MATEKEIKALYKEEHRILSHRYYFGTLHLSKEEFDKQHGEIWEEMAAELVAAGFLPLPLPGLSLESLEKRVYDLENRS